MKLFHLSDLHLGKRVNEFSMLEDQAYILNQILEFVDRESPDGMIVAGDIYDKPVPPAEAVQMLDDFLTELSKRKVTVFLISGNHDSPERLSFGSRLMEAKGIHFSPVYDGRTYRVMLEDSYGPVFLYLLPYVKPSVVRHIYESEEILTYQDAVGAAIRYMDIDRTERNVLAAHQFVTGAGRCESEEILVGGLDNVDAALFDDFDYVALGHIHSPQYIGRETVRYSGTPLKYSFSETGQEKSITVVELKEKGNVSVRQIPLRPIRDMRKIRGTYLEVTSLSFYKGSNTEDYLQITLTDEGDIPDGLQKLRVIYPNLMRLEYDNRRTRQNREMEEPEAVEKKSELELFQDFYQIQNNQPMSSSQIEFVRTLIENLQET